MAKAYSGRDGQLRIGDTTIGKVTAWSLEASVEMLETTSLGDNVRTFSAGLQAFSGSATLLYYKDDNDAIDATQLLTRIIKTGTEGIDAGDRATMTLRLVDGTDINDLTFNAYITGAQIGAAVGEIVSASISFQVDGGLTTATI